MGQRMSSAPSPSHHKARSHKACPGGRPVLPSRAAPCGLRPRPRRPRPLGSQGAVKHGEKWGFNVFGWNNMGNPLSILYTYMYACMIHVCMYACMPVCMYVRMYARMYVCMSVCMYVCMHACMYVCL